MSAKLPRMRKGDPLTARYFNNMEDAVRELQDAIPKDRAIAEDVILDGELAGAETFTEVERETSTVRVENPDDASQYVDVERIDRIVMQRASDGLLVNFVFDNPDNGS